MKIIEDLYQAEKENIINQNIETLIIIEITSFNLIHENY
jgi:hypothetical protein